MKNKIAKIVSVVLAFGSESTLGYLYSLIGPEHGGIITQVEQDIFVKVSFKLLCLALSFVAARHALREFKIRRGISRAVCCGVVVLLLLSCSVHAFPKQKKNCENDVRKIDLVTPL